MFAQVVIINLKPDRDLPCAIVHHVMDRLCHIEGPPVSLSLLEDA